MAFSKSLFSRRSIFVGVATLFMAGCVNPSTDVMPMGPDTYTVTGSSNLGIANAHKDALRKANAYAEKKGLNMIPVSTRSASEGNMMSWSGTMYSFELTFRLVSNNDPEYRRPNLQPVPTTVIQDQRGISNPPPANPAPARQPATDPGKYDKLLKLKQLLDSKAITQEEYDKEKALILGGA
jgi:hypothetical protein